jgi:hypothetical protein
MEPVKHGTRQEEPCFKDEEQLFRRFPPEVKSEVLATSIRFDEPPSFCRSKFARPEDTIHRNCADGQDVSRFGVFAVPVAAARIILKDTNQKCYHFEPKHRPEPTCYAHTEIHCLMRKDSDVLAGSDIHSKPPLIVRNQFRARIAIALVEVIPAKH